MACVRGACRSKIDFQFVDTKVGGSCKLYSFVYRKVHLED